MGEIPKRNAPGRKIFRSKSTIETPEQTAKFTLKVYKNDIRTYLSFTACPMSSVWDFEHVFSNWAIAWGHIRIYLQIKYLHFSYCSFSLIEIFQLEFYVGSFKYPANIYLLKLNNRHAGTRCVMYVKLVSEKFLLLWYWVLSCLFLYCFSLSKLLERFCFYFC